MSRPAIIPAVVVITPIALIALIAAIRKAPRVGADLSRAGLMELQNQLEPGRKVEILRELETKEDLLVRLDDAGEGPPVRIPRGRRPVRLGSHRPRRPL